MSWQTRFQLIRNNKIFEAFIIAIIIASALVVGVKTYAIPTPVLFALTVLDYVITAVFLIELLIRFLAEENKWRFFHSGWNLFDTLIVAVSLIPLENADMALVARLIRVFRVLRMISIIPELRMLLNSMLVALPRLGYAVALMFIIFYIYAAVGSLFFNQINEVLWGDIAISMLTLFRVMTFEDWTDVMYETMDVYPFSWMFFVTFIFLTAFAFLNMIIGIVVNVLEEEHEKARQADPDHVSLEDLQSEIRELKGMVKTLSEQHAP